MGWIPQVTGAEPRAGAEAPGGQCSEAGGRQPGLHTWHTDAHVCGGQRGSGHDVPTRKFCQCRLSKGVVPNVVDHYTVNITIGDKKYLLGLYSKLDRKIVSLLGLYLSQRLMSSLYGFL